MSHPYLTCVFCIMINAKDIQPAITVFSGNATCPDHVNDARKIADGAPWHRVVSELRIEYRRGGRYD